MQAAVAASAGYAAASGAAAVFDGRGPMGAGGGSWALCGGRRSYRWGTAQLLMCQDPRSYTRALSGGRRNYRPYRSSALSGGRRVGRRDRDKTPTRDAGGVGRLRVRRKSAGCAAAGRRLDGAARVCAAGGDGSTCLRRSR